MRTGVCYFPAVVLIGILLSSSGPAHLQAGSWGPMTGIDKIGIRVPIVGAIPSDAEGVNPRDLYFKVREFLTPRAPGISIESRSPAFRLEVYFSFIRVPPESAESAGYLVLSYGWLESMEERLAERDYTGTSPPPLHRVEGLKIWNSAPEYAFAEDRSDIQGEVGKLVEIHVNRFLDAWFEDNAGGQR